MGQGQLGGLKTARPAEPHEIPLLARLWHDAWHETQAGSLPSDLIALRTLADFEARLLTLLDGLRVTGPVGAPAAFCATLDLSLIHI